MELPNFMCTYPMLFLGVHLFLHGVNGNEEIYPFRNITLTWEERVDDLVSRLTVEEIVGQISDNGGKSLQDPCPAIPRLGIKPFNFNSECLRGVKAPNRGTAFPQNVGLTASFNPDLVFHVAAATGDELRAIHQYTSSHGDYGLQKGLNCFAPCINILRHPLWGRNQEVYGEDPFMSGLLAASFVKGLQGNHPRYVRVSATCKHYDAYSGPENLNASRFAFNAEVSERDMMLTYLRNFRSCIEAGSHGVMCSYSSINGIPACANKKLLDLGRNMFNFTGFYLSDAGAIEFMRTAHHYVKTPMEAALAALNAGINYELPFGKAYFGNLTTAYTQGNVSLQTLQDRVKPLFYTRMRLGEFDPPSMNPYSNMSMSLVQSKAHRELAIQAAAQTFVLLKNERNTLPLTKKINNMAIVGPISNALGYLYGDYAATPVPKFAETPYQGLKSVALNSTRLAAGCNDANCMKYDKLSVQHAVIGADVVVVCLGSGSAVEHESRDRANMEMPGHQLDLLKDAAAAAGGKPVILLLFTGGPVDVSWAKNSPSISAILQCFFPAQGTGAALLRVLLGQGGISPAGRLPYTWYASIDQVPQITNYSMDGRTYRYFKGPGQPLYPFGYGLSYSEKFLYSGLKISPTTVKGGEDVTVYVTVTNQGTHSSDEVSQVYISWVDCPVPMPQIQLVAITRTSLSVGKKTLLKMVVHAQDMQIWDDDKGFIYHKGEIKVSVGGQQPGQTTQAPSNILTGSFYISP